MRPPRIRQIHTARSGGWIAGALIAVMMMVFAHPASAAVAFRDSSSSGALGGGTSLTINKPAAVVDNDVMLLVFYVENTAVVPSVAGSWTLIDNITSGTAFQMYVWYRRAAAEPASYAITWPAATVQRSALIVAYSGAITTGSPVDVYSERTNAGSTSMTATGVTPANTDDMLVFLGTHWFTSDTGTPPTGMGERYDAASIYAADQLLASNAPTGDKIATFVSGSANSAYLVALKAAAPGWYNASWQCRKKITVDQTKVGSGGVSNFPVLINRTDTDLQSKAQADGDDILFTSSDGTTKLSHEIEKYVSATGELIAWVKVPSVSAAAPTDIYMYYGNTTAADAQDAANVWDANYTAVWHFKESSSPAADSKGSYNGTWVGTPTQSTGKVG